MFAVCGRLSAFVATVALAARLSASHLPNPAMEEAASLFGPADLASDPFGSIVTHGGDDLAGSSTSPPSELSLSNTREVDTGGNWYDGASSHYQPEGSLHPEYDWRSGNDAGHYNFQLQYEGSTPSNFSDNEPPHPYTASHDGELSPPSRGLISPRVQPEFSWSCLWDAATLRAEC